MNRTYLVTGGAGFIGSNFITYKFESSKDITIINLDSLTYAGNLENLDRIREDTRYVFVQGDISDPVTVRSIFNTYDIQYVVNFAAESHVDRSIDSPEVFVKTNVVGTLNLLNIAKEYWSLGNGTFREDVRFLQVSTDEVYGSLGTEGLFTEKTPLDPHSPYAASKASADMLVKAYRDTYGFPMNITRCSNNYGPYQFPEKFIPLIINNCLTHKHIPVYGDGLQIRDWLHVKDHCRALDMVLLRGKTGEIYNIGGQNELTNMNIVQYIIEYMSKHVESGISKELITHVTDRKGHDRRYGIDSAKIRFTIGWEPEIDFEKGMKETIDWYLSHRSWINHVASGEYQTYYGLMYGGKEESNGEF